jgi:hypothetical protein
LQTKKTAPFDVSNDTTQPDSNFQCDNKKYLRPGLTVRVRWPGQTSGAFGLALNFLCYFLCFKPKKVKEPASSQKEQKAIAIFPKIPSAYTFQ